MDGSFYISHIHQSLTLFPLFFLLLVILSLFLYNIVHFSTVMILLYSTFHLTSTLYSIKINMYLKFCVCPEGLSHVV